MNFVYLLFGVAFGFVLSRASATNYDTIIRMFQFVDMRLAGMMAVAIVVVAIGLRILRRKTNTALAGCPIEVHRKPSHRYMLPAGLVFGTGWALSGG